MTPTGHIDKTIKNIPNKTGVYQYYDKNQSLLYVGKAKNLKKRVSSYFTKNQENERIKILISKIQDIKYVLVETEMDALLLENNLIKNQQPKYNVLLKDGKTYPWICISNEKIPRVFQTREIKNTKGEYFGPYTSTHMVKTLLSVFSDLFYNHGWTPISYINRTIESEKELLKYLSIVSEIRKILNGNLYSLMNDLKKTMRLYAKQLKFEHAQIIKEKIALLKKYQSKSIVVNPKITNVDVFTIISDEHTAFVNFLNIKSGSVIQSYTLELRKKMNESEEKLLKLAIIELRQRFKSSSKKIYCSLSIKNFCSSFAITVPKIGGKKKLIALSLQNARHMLLDKKRQKMNTLERQHNIRILQKLQNDLRLKETPKHIECFDISNLQGENTIASCVVFKNGTPSKKDYRYFNIKTVDGPNDYASIEEGVYRRYKRVLGEENSLPNLIVVDGGKGQLNSALKSLEKLNLRGKIGIIGIAKRLEEIYFPEDSLPLYLDKRSEGLKLIQRIRNEAHRFGILHHRNKRVNSALSVSLDKIKGIGPKTVRLLITHFGSVKQVNKATEAELITVIGKTRANKILRQSLRNN